MSKPSPARDVLNTEPIPNGMHVTWRGWPNVEQLFIPNMIAAGYNLSVGPAPQYDLRADFPLLVKR